MIISFATMDITLEEMWKALIVLRDDQSLIKCTDADDDICGDFDNLIDKVTDLRERFTAEKVKLLSRLEKVQEHGQKHEFTNAIADWNDRLDPNPVSIWLDISNTR